MLLNKITIENFRGISKLEVELDRTTVIIGENNVGKTSFLEVIRLCLGRPLSRRSNLFEDYDHHLPNKEAQFHEVGTLSITLDFAETKPDEWSKELQQSIPDVIVIHTPQNIRHITLQITSKYDEAIGDFSTDWEFLNAVGAGLGPRSKNPQIVSMLQRLCPAFYLSAVRDASKEFAARSNFWAPFLRNPDITPELQQELAEQLEILNNKILDAHSTLNSVKENLKKTQGHVALGTSDQPISIEPLPGRISDMLARTQVNITSHSGASLPLSSHGAGTQSLSVIFLFEAFVNSMLTRIYDSLSEPILTIEEPEAHLHPNAIRSLWKSLNEISGQKIIATHSGDLLSRVPIENIRRFARDGQSIKVYKLENGTLNDEEKQRVDYHVRSSRGELFYAKCWLLVEGESEYWTFSEIAETLECDLDLIGIRIVNYRSSGIEPLIKVANDFGIKWHVFADGDSQGNRDIECAKRYLSGRAEVECISQVPHNSIEVFFCESGFGSIFETHISPQKRASITLLPNQVGYWDQVIKAKDDTSKPTLIREVMSSIRLQGVTSIPSLFVSTLQTVQSLAEN